MKTSFYLILFFIFSFSNSFLAQKVSNPEFDLMLSKLLSHSVPEINPSNAILTEALFMDAREPEEYKVSHLPNAINVGYNYFNLKKWTHLSKEQPIIVYCSVGYRSEKIALQLKNNGFKNVKNLYGGIFEWKHQNKPIVKNYKETDSIHTYNKEWSQWLTNGIKVY